MQPSGTLHWGNYFGSMKPNLEKSSPEDESLFFVVDLHALTTLHDAELLRKSRLDSVRDYIAAGFDPEQVIVFFQSSVQAHAELSWILSCITPMGLLERAVSYKDKLEKGIAASAGLFTYPVLMAADILRYNADLVQVGKDQKQHVEITRDIALNFNNTFGETFTVPDVSIQEEVAVVPGTDGQKMSKSYGNTIPLFGDEKVIKKAIMGIQTDSKGMNDPKDPDTCPIFKLHALFLDETERGALAQEYRDGIPYGDAKKRLFAAYMDSFASQRGVHEKLTDDYLYDVMNEGAVKANAIASETIETVRKRTGLL